MFDAKKRMKRLKKRKRYDIITLINFMMEICGVCKSSPMWVHSLYLTERMYKSMNKKDYLECGKLTNTHGVYGAMKAESWCDSVQVLASLPCVYLLKNEVYTPLHISRASIFKQLVIFEFEEVPDMDTAEMLKGSVIYAARKDIPVEEGSVFIVDMIGLPVIDANSGKVYGTLKDVNNLGASDLYVVTTPNGERLIPSVPEFVQKIDIESGIYVTPIPGLLD